MTNPIEEAPPRRVDIGKWLDESRWSGFQISVLALAALTVVLDGFDNQVLGFAIPAITKEWGVSRGNFAPVLALGFLGMSIGTLIAGYLGDRFGRRPALIASVLIFALATGLTALAQNIPQFAILRTLTGMGLGGALPNAAALIAEFTPLRRRPIAVTAMIVCIPLGGMVGGLIAAKILPLYGWRTLFGIGGLSPLIVGVMLMRLLPESPQFLLAHPDRWAELDKVMRQSGYRPVAGDVFLEKKGSPVEKNAIAALFSPGSIRDTLSLWLAFFSCLLGVYMVFSWLPTLLSSAGFDLAFSSYGLTIFNLGGVLGALTGAWLITVIGSRRAMVFMALGGVLSSVILIFLPKGPLDGVAALMVALFISGAFINAVQSTLYALATYVYAAHIRATGVGAAAAIGRTGAIASSFVGAAILVYGADEFFGLLAVTLSVTLIALLLLRRHIPKLVKLF